MSRLFKVSLISIYLWTSLMGLTNPSSGGILKIIIAILLWISFFSTLKYTISNFNFIISGISKTSRVLIFSILLVNLFNIVRCFFPFTGSYFTLFGNQYMALSLLIPISMVWAININNIAYFRTLLQKAILIGLVFSPFVLLFSNNSFNIFIYNFLLGSIFFITSFRMENKITKLQIILSLLFIFSFVYTENRSMFIRAFLLFIFGLSFYRFENYKSRLIRQIIFSLILIPIYFVVSGYVTGESIFQKISSYDQTDASIDTRTFLYSEVTDDLLKTNSLILGKGANSSYFSSYFTDEVNIKNNRLTVEVGILTVLLKGGIISVLLNIWLFSYSIYKSFFNSRNYYSKALGLFLLVHLLLLFIENFIAYDVYNFIVWFVVGLCLNIKFRSLTNKQISILINGKQKNLYRNP